MQKHAQKKNETPHTLIGTWINGDEYATEVEYIVSAIGKGFAVQALDRFDGERGEVYDVTWDGTALSFGVHWQSTGRFVKARFLAIYPNRVDYTFTVTKNEIWHRKKSKPTARPNGRSLRRAAK